MGAASVWFTNGLVKKLSEEEKKKVEIWAESLSVINSDVDQDIRLHFAIAERNTTIPVIHVDENNIIIRPNNLRKFEVPYATQFKYDSLNEKDKEYLNKQLEIMKSKNDPIKIVLDSGTQYLYFKNSFLLTQLRYFPYFQFLIMLLFIMVSYFAISSSNKAEQNQVWVGMSKETAHQLGTPISSLLAWVELLRGSKHNLVPEIEKDVQRLEKITERFSKIGSAPILTKENIIEVIDGSIEYLRTRSSEKIKFTFEYPDDQEIFVPVNISLFEWVIENLCKNSIDAMNGSGDIIISLTDHHQVVYLDIQDSGKGITKSMYKAVFQPGYTTKQRGWGLGLSLTNRIIENYHSGKIFVKRSEINKGTTFRIVLKK